MASKDSSEAEQAFLGALGRLGPALLNVLSGLEIVARRLDPAELPALRQAIGAPGRALEEALQVIAGTEVPQGLSDLSAQLARAGQHATRAVSLFVGSAGRPDAIADVLTAMHEHCLAQSAVFPLRAVFPAIDRHFVEPNLANRLPSLAEGAGSGRRVGLMSASNGEGERGGFSLYVPEDYDDSRDWPIVVALHGGHGHGADFIWTWLREARGRGFLLLAPTSQGSTWSMNGPDVDHGALLSMLEYVKESWRVDEARMLLTGLSDGATYSLLLGLSEDSPFDALAPVSGVLHPANAVLGNLERAAGKRIYLVHGARDWMFPVQLARDAAAQLERSGADLTYREIEDLSHTYPREENGAMLDWLAGALPPPS
jgi:phospholipase/carboxylesterase